MCCLPLPENRNPTLIIHGQMKGDMCCFLKVSFSSVYKNKEIKRVSQRESNSCKENVNVRKNNIMHISSKS